MATEYEENLIGLAMFCLIGGLILTIIGIKAYTPERYQVIVEDTVSMTEFNEHYKIIEQNGEIYTVDVKE